MKVELPEELLDLGAASEETQGDAPMGPEEGGRHTPTGLVDE